MAVDGEMPALESQFNQCAITAEEEAAALPDSTEPPCTNVASQDEESGSAAGESESESDSDDLDEVIADILEGGDDGGSADYYTGPLLPEGTMLLTKTLVDKILALRRRRFPMPPATGGERLWWVSPEFREELIAAELAAAAVFDASQDKFVECQAMIAEKRHPEHGFFGRYNESDDDDDDDLLCDCVDANECKCGGDDWANEFIDEEDDDCSEDVDEKEEEKDEKIADQMCRLRWRQATMANNSFRVITSIMEEEGKMDFWVREEKRPCTRTRAAIARCNNRADGETIGAEDNQRGDKGWSLWSMVATVGSSNVEDPCRMRRYGKGDEASGSVGDEAR
uniref:Uncharacterized protein n=1 Tax=Oryza glaberrima TaxID=4538 RepID=I1R1L1_ORYGL